ncbi:MAG TPA: amidohydrolase family protein [Candidatus Saccharimonadales bacterium]|nr:amidohydrolase family protein [Candidatus Saccharimonadales bacterium]
MVQLLVKNGIHVTLDPERRILEEYSLVINDGKIVNIGRTNDLEKKYLNSPILDASGCIVMPGIICSHSHLYGMLLRGASLNIAPPSDFTQILQRVWWPVDEAMTLEDAYASALIASVEFAKSGVTTFADTYSGPNSMDGVLDYVARAVEQVGIRGFIAFEATERHSRDEGFRGVQEGVRFAEKIRKTADSKVQPLFSIHASFTVSDELIREVKRLAVKYNAPITIHTSEGLGDLHHNLENYGKRTIERLSDLGLLGPDVILAHCVNLNDDEIDTIAKTKSGVAHNPMSNMLNAVGVAPILKMREKNITIGLGNDGYIFDMFENMRSAFLLQRAFNRDPNAIDPYAILEMATINGAKLYGFEKQIGSLEIGKKADLIIIRPEILPTPLTPNTVIGHLINTVDGDDVENVLVEGKFIVKEKQLVTFDEDKAESISQSAASNLWNRMKESKPQIDPLRK